MDKNSIENSDVVLNVLKPHKINDKIRFDGQFKNIKTHQLSDFTEISPIDVMRIFKHANRLTAYIR